MPVGEAEVLGFVLFPSGFRQNGGTEAVALDKFCNKIIIMQVTGIFGVVIIACVNSLGLLSSASQLVLGANAALANPY